MSRFIQRLQALAVVFSVICTIPTVWANHHEHEAQASQTSGMIKGEVRRIDAENRKITIKHEAIPDLDMAAMTMAFRLADTISIDKLKPGDKIRFSLGKVEGKWVVVAIEADSTP
jgi:Cu(I)/Ag(I) efflux system periplasmic protein CusF